MDLILTYLYIYKLIMSIWKTKVEEVEINNESPGGFSLAYCVPSFQLSADRFLRYR